MSFRVLRRLVCRLCDQDWPSEYLDWQPNDDYGTHADCGGRIGCLPETFSTDVRGQAFYSEAADRDFTTLRQQDKFMGNVTHEIGDTGYSVKGYTPCGDKVHGARLDLSITNAAFSGGGLTSRTSSRERELSRQRTS